ncbi:hypothetical protein FRC04_003652 [Tulasnella sp. 424]|nr:hypothetical protein FRC04_003652 [Tulasnella sp. 424]
MNQYPQLKYPPRTMTRKGEQLFCLSPEGGGRYLEVPGPIKEKLAAETGVSYAQIQNYLRNKHQSIRAAQATPTIFPIVPHAAQHPSLPPLSVKPAPEGARKAKELLLFGDIPEAKLDRLHALLHLTPDATESEALDWAEPLELSENRVLAWFRYQLKSGASQSPAPPKPEEIDELSTPRTLVKHELSPEPTVSDARSRSRAYSSPMETGMDTDEDQLAEVQASRQAQPPSEQPFPSSVQKVTSPPITQLPTPTASAFTSPNPPESGQIFAQLQEPKLSPSFVPVVGSAARPGTAGHSARPDLEDGEIAMENVERRPGSSSVPTVGVPMTKRDSISSVGDRTGNSFPVLTPAASRAPDLPFASPTRQSPSRGGPPSGSNSWNRLSHSRQPSWEDSSRHQESGSRNGPPSPYRGYGKGKAQERFAVVNEYQDGSAERGLGPHRDRPRPARLQTHPYHVPLPTSSHHDRYPPSASTSDATTPSTSRSVASSSTGGASASPPFRGPDACRIIQAVSIALRDLPALSARMDADSIAEDATSTVAQNVEKIQEFNSWAIGAAKSLGVTLQGVSSRGSMPPPPNPASCSSFRK